jgi:hypothetical protein
MTQQLRYHTLVNNIGKIYASESSVRTPLLQKGLDEIVGAIKPAEPADWKRVKADSEKLLHVWNVKEDSTASAAVVKMLTDMLNELSTTSLNHRPFEMPDRISHIHSAWGFDLPNESDDDGPLVTVSKLANPMEVKIEEIARVEPTKSVAAPVTTKSVIIESKEECKSIEGDAEEEVEEVEEEEQQEENEGEVLEPEEEPAEEVVEEGLEVEEYISRGRKYWLDSKSQKLYANLEGDDVGDEIGALVNGKPVFLAK